MKKLIIIFSIFLLLFSTVLLAAGREKNLVSYYQDEIASKINKISNYVFNNPRSQNVEKLKTLNNKLAELLKYMEEDEQPQSSPQMTSAPLSPTPMPSPTPIVSGVEIKTVENLYLSGKYVRGTGITTEKEAIESYRKMAKEYEADLKRLLGDRFLSFNAGTIEKAKENYSTRFLTKNGTLKFKIDSVREKVISITCEAYGKYYYGDSTGSYDNSYSTYLEEVKSIIDLNSQVAIKYLAFYSMDEIRNLKSAENGKQYISNLSLYYIVPPNATTEYSTKTIIGEELFGSSDYNINKAFDSLKKAFGDWVDTARNTSSVIHFSLGRYKNIGEGSNMQFQADAKKAFLIFK